MIDETHDQKTYDALVEVYVGLDVLLQDMPSFLSAAEIGKAMKMASEALFKISKIIGDHAAQERRVSDKVLSIVARATTSAHKVLDAIISSRLGHV